MYAEKIVRKLDELTNENLFVPLFNKYSESYTVPEYESILADLGVKQKKLAGGDSFNNNAPYAGIRQQINQQQKR